MVAEGFSLRESRKNVVPTKGTMATAKFGLFG